MKAEALIYALFQARTTDLDNLGALLAADAVFEFPYAASAGLVGRIEGREAVVRHLRDLAEGAGPAQFSFSDLRAYPGADPDAAWFEVRATAELPGGKRYEQDHVVFLRAANGKIALYREYGNMAALPGAEGGSQTRILVLGGTGKTGAPIVRLLVERGFETYAASRSSERRFDWNDPSSWNGALSGITRLFAVAPLADPRPQDRMIPLFERALARGVNRIVVLSSPGVTEDTPGLGEVVRWVRLNVPEWTVLRPSWLMQSFVDPASFHARTIAEAQTIVSATGEGRVPFVDAEDLAEIAVRALTDEAPHQASLDVTGPEALSYDDVARILGAEHVATSADELATFLVTHGIRPGFANLIVLLDTLVASGQLGEVADTIPRLLGRPARSFEEFASRRSVSSNPTSIAGP